MGKLKDFAWGAFFLAALSACSLFDKDEPLPSYLTIMRPQVLVDSSQGFLANPYGLKDIWLYQNNFLQGVYYFPEEQNSITIPFLSTGEGRQNFFINGGIYLNGISTRRREHPYWEAYEFEVTLPSLDSIVIQPTLEYINETGITYVLEEDFEGIGQIFQSVVTDTTGEAELIIDNTAAFEGSHSGKVQFDANNKFFSVVNSFPSFIDFDLAQHRDVLLELTYKSEVVFGIALRDRGNNTLPVDVIYLTPSEDWQTVFVYLNEAIVSINDVVLNPNFGVEIFTSVETDAPKNLYLDKIRLIHRKANP